MTYLPDVLIECLWFKEAQAAGLGPVYLKIKDEAPVAKVRMILHYPEGDYAEGLDVKGWGTRSGRAQAIVLAAAVILDSFEEYLDEYNQHRGAD